MYSYYETTEEYLLAIDKYFANDEFMEGKKLIEELLTEDPGCAQAHNSLGWIYFYKLDDYKSAAKHFKLSIKFDPDYPFSYRNYVYMEMYLGNYKNVITMVKQAIKVPGSEIANLYNEMGKAFELLGEFIDAKNAYSKALFYNTNEENRIVYTANAKRAYNKMPFYRKIQTHLPMNSR